MKQIDKDRSLKALDDVIEQIHKAKLVIISCPENKTVSIHCEVNTSIHDGEHSLMHKSSLEEFGERQ